MNGYQQGYSGGRGAGMYKSTEVESGTMSADPHHLIVMLFDGAEMFIRKARMYILDGNIPEKGRAISKAIDIVNQGLLAALDRERGGEIAENLALIYDYIGRLLLQANIHNDLNALKQAEGLLADIGSAWRQIETQAKVG